MTRWTEADLAAIRRKPPLSAAAVTARPSKYGNEPVEAHGLRFASKWQAQRYTELLMMQRAGLIRDLAVEQPFALSVRGIDGSEVRLGSYVADTVYWQGGRLVVEDAKSASTRREKLFVWKARHFAAQYGFEISIVERTKPRSGSL